MQLLQIHRIGNPDFKNSLSAQMFVVRALAHIKMLMKKQGRIGYLALAADGRTDSTEECFIDSNVQEHFVMSLFSPCL